MIQLSREARLMAGITLLTVPMLYLGAASLAVAVLLTGVGLLRRSRGQNVARS